MASITIHIDEGIGQFQLAGETNDLWANRRAKFFIQDYLQGVMSGDQKLNIPYLKDTQNDKERVLTQVTELLDRFKIGYSLTNTVEHVLKHFLDEKERFAEFSKKAKLIWNNEVDTAEFKHFTDTIKEKMPNRTLYDLQLLSAYHLAFAQNACNFSVPGAGKTSIVYAAYAYLKALPRDHWQYVNKLMIIGPLSSFGPWEDEYKACFGIAGDIRRLSGGVPKEDRIRHFLSPHSAEITLMSYQAVPSNLDDIISYLRRYENKVMVVLDEAHKIKNTDGGVWAQAVLSLAKYCKSRVVLTGTPAPNGYEDIYNLYNFIWPDKNIIDFHLYQLKEMSNNPNDSRVQELVDKLSPFFIRITKKDLIAHMDLPAATENPPELVKMGPIQRYIYDFLEENYIPYFEKTVDNDLKNALTNARLIRLLQASTNPALLQRPIGEFYRQEGIPNELFIDDSGLIENILNYRNIETPEKFKKVAELTQKILNEGGKVVIWGIFIQTIKSLQEYLASLGLASKLLIGEVPVDNELTMEGIETREHIVREFNREESSFKIIIANPFAVAESISLHKTCHNAIYIERNFNVATFLQSKDRIHRVGLKPDNKINYYYLLSEDSIDETVHTRLIEKEENMLKIIESKDIPLISLNMDDDELDPKDRSERVKDIKILIQDYRGRIVKIR